MHNESSNPDVYVLTLARPADPLTALVSSMAVRHPADIAFCGSVYDLIAALQRNSPQRPVILIARPSMLAKPHLMAALRQYPNLRLVGWLGADEKFSDPAVFSLSGQVLVSSPEQLRSVIAGLQNSLVRDLEVPAQDSKIEPVNYRLSDEELDALLGAEK